MNKFNFQKIIDSGRILLWYITAEIARLKIYYSFYLNI